MSEEIIRNGVDVSGCGYFDTINDTECSIVGLGKSGEDTFCGKCFGNPNCYYKQLKRLQAENEQLKKENEEINRRMSDVIYRATGGRLCYSTYTLDAIENAFQDQLEILSDRKTEELEREIEELRIKYAGCNTANTAIQQENEELQSENELLKDANAHLKTELKQRYDEPDFKSFRLMGKTIEEWKQLETENDLLKRLLNEKAKTLDKMTGIYSARLCKKYKQALEEIRGILCKGRTFYDGYFENENLSRTDKAIKVISEVLG